VCVGAYAPTHTFFSDVSHLEAVHKSLNFIFFIQKRQSYIIKRRMP